MSYKINDPWQSAMDPETIKPEVVGKMTVDVYFFQFQDDGSGKKSKIHYDDANVDSKGRTLRRYTGIDVLIEPLDPERFDVKRSFIGEIGEWKDVVLPSLRAIGANNLADLNGAYVRAHLVDTDRTYTNKDGDLKTATTIEFLEVYPNEQAALEAAGLGTPVSAAAGGNGAKPQSTGDAQRDSALKFLEVYVKNAVKANPGNLEAIRTKLASDIANQTMLAKYFTVDSPEVVDLLAVQLA